jgi:hypothetical protein
LHGRYAIVAVLLVALSGCGGGGDDGESSSSTTMPAQSAPTSAQGKAVNEFTRTAQAYWDEFRNCGSSPTPTRGFFEACTKRTRREFQAAEDTVLRALERSKTGACKQVANRLRGVMARAGAAIERTVVAFDRSNNASLKGQAYNGPPPQQLFPGGQRAIDEDLPDVRKLSQTIDAGC